MIVDVHTHIGKAEHYGERYFEGEEKGGTKDPKKGGVATEPSEHWKAMESVDKVIVVGFRTELLGCNVPNDYVTDYVRQHPDKLIGFMSVDATQEGVMEELERCYYDLGLKGIKLSPIYQGFHPQDERVLPIYEKAEKLGLLTYGERVWHELHAKTEVADGEWHHIAGTYDKKALRAYVNGNFDAELAATDIPNDVPEPVRIGGGSDDFAKGIIDDVGLFNVALSEDEINDIMKEGVGRATGVSAVSSAGKLAIAWGKIKAEN